MRKTWILAVLSFATLAAFAVIATTEATSSAAVTTSPPTATPPVTRAANCSQVWECDQVCGTWVNGTLVRYPTNVLHLECDDGTDTVLHQDPCGEACF
jgi:ABC-type glycerol-3-phosphate transport system permease component